MDLQSEKIELVKLLLETESREVINEIKAVFKKQGNDFYDDLPQHVKDSIERGLKDIEAGEAFTTENLRVIRPADGLEPKYYDLIVGKKASKAIKAGTPLSWDIM